MAAEICELRVDVVFDETQMHRTVVLAVAAVEGICSVAGDFGSVEQLLCSSEHRFECQMLRHRLGFWRIAIAITITEVRGPVVRPLARIRLRGYLRALVEIIAPILAGCESGSTAARVIAMPLFGFWSGGLPEADPGFDSKF